MIYPVISASTVSLQKKKKKSEWLISESTFSVASEFEKPDYERAVCSNNTAATVTRLSEPSRPRKSQARLNPHRVFNEVTQPQTPPNQEKQAAPLATAWIHQQNSLETPHRAERPLATNRPAADASEMVNATEREMKQNKPLCPRLRDLAPAVHQAQPHLLTA